MSRSISRWCRCGKRSAPVVGMLLGLFVCSGTMGTPRDLDALWRARLASAIMERTYRLGLTCSIGSKNLGETHVVFGLRPVETLPPRKSSERGVAIQLVAKEFFSTLPNAQKKDFALFTREIIVRSNGMAMEEPPSSRDEKFIFDLINGLLFFILDESPDDTSESPLDVLSPSAKVKFGRATIADDKDGFLHIQFLNDKENGTRRDSESGDRTRPYYGYARINSKTGWVHEASLKQSRRPQDFIIECLEVVS